MAPSATKESSLHDLNEPRPLKRQRKSPAGDDLSHNGPVQPQPIDHIFITEGNVMKKPGGKKAPLSCCECRRLKLKCDRNFPCASCKKRGCAEICPEGVLVSGKGTRFILANTEQLHEKIHEMSERIRVLEEAVDQLQTQCSPEPHPLLEPQLLTIKSTMVLYGNTQAGPLEPSSSSSSYQNAQTPNNHSSDMMVDQYSETKPKLAASVSHPRVEQTSDEMFAEVLRLSQSYPLPENVAPEPNLKLRDYIRSMLPDRGEAEHLWRQALENALWQYNPHPSETFFPNLAHHCYTSPIDDLSPRRLALLYMILAVGCLVDIKHRGPDSPDAEKYHQYARAALCEIPVMEETNVETITALFYEIWYLMVFSDKKKAAGYAWGLMGLTAKLAQSIGLHRGGGGSKVIPEEVEKRRSLFWELLYLDARLSLSLGRPPSLNVRYQDCPRPSYRPDYGTDPLLSFHAYQEWKHSWYLSCLAPVLDVISQPVADYGFVIELDTRIRDFSFPQPLRSAVLRDRSLYMQKASLAIALEAVLLQLHRSYFTRALSGPEEAFNRRHKYAPSVVAVFLSASRMIATVEDLYHREPQLTARILGYWSNAFSAAVALCLLVSRAPFTCLSPAVLQELERARGLFKLAKDTCPRAQQVIPILETMVNKANDIYNRWSEGQEVQLMLRHVVGEDQLDQHDYGGDISMTTNGRFVASPSPPAPPSGADPFSKTHRSLRQCIAEVHERAKLMFPNRKPCNCSGTAKSHCPPSHFWMPPPPNTGAGSPVLPSLYSQDYDTDPSPRQSHTVDPTKNGAAQRPPPLNGGQEVQRQGPPQSHPIQSNSKLISVDSINLELGAFNSSSDQPWMSFF